MFPLIATRHGSRRLYEVRRFERAWEARGLAEAPRRRHHRPAGLQGATAWSTTAPQDRMHDDAVDAWLTDYAEGKDDAPAGRQQRGSRRAGPAGPRAARRARPARPGRRDHALGRQRGRDRRPGPGPAEHEDRRGRADAQQPRHDQDHRMAGQRDAAGRRPPSGRPGPGRWSAPFDVPAAYLEQNAELDYAGQRVRQPRAAPSTRHTWWSAEAMSRDLALRRHGRGREQNRLLFVVTGPPEPAAMTRREREATRKRVAEAAAACWSAATSRRRCGVDLAPEPEPTWRDRGRRGRRSSPRSCTRTTRSARRSSR